MFCVLRLFCDSARLFCMSILQEYGFRPKKSGKSRRIDAVMKRAPPVYAECIDDAGRRKQLRGRGGTPLFCRSDAAGGIQPPIQRQYARAVIPLGNDAGKIDDERINKHNPDDPARREQPEHPERRDSEPVRELSARGFHEKSPQVLLGVVGQIPLLVAALFPDSAAVRQKMLPAPNAKHVLVDPALPFPGMRAPEKPVRCEDAVRKKEANEREQYRRGRPDGEEQRDCR